MRFLLPVLLIIFLPQIYLHAQSVKIEVAAGAGLSVETGSKVNTDYLADWGAHLIIAPHIPLGKATFLRLGAGYDRKTLHARFDYTDEDEHRHVYDIRRQYQLLTIPLQVGGTISIRGRERIQVSGGMNYHFLIAGQVKSHISAYSKNGVVFQDQDLSYSPKIFLAPPANRVSSTNESGFLLFNPAVYLDAGYLIRHRGLVKEFYEYYLNDVETSFASPGYSHIHYAGISLGWML